MKKIKYYIVIVSIITFSACKNAKVIQDKVEVSAFGCGNFSVFKPIDLDIKNDAYLRVRFKDPSIILTNKFTSFEIENNETINGSIEVLNQTEGIHNYCTDALTPDISAIEIHQIISGTVQARVSSLIDVANRKNNAPYKIDVILENATVLINSKPYKINEVIFSNVYVNFLMG